MVKILVPGGSSNLGQGMPRQHAYSALEGMPYNVQSSLTEFARLGDRGQHPSRLQTIMSAQTLKPTSRYQRLERAGIKAPIEDRMYDRQIDRQVTPFRNPMVDVLTFKSGRSTQYVNQQRPKTYSAGDRLVRINMGFNRY